MEEDQKTAESNYAGLSVQLFFERLQIRATLGYYEAELGVKGRIAVMRKAFPNADLSFLDALPEDT